MTSFYIEQVGAPGVSVTLGLSREEKESDEEFAGRIAASLKTQPTLMRLMQDIGRALQSEFSLAAQVAQMEEQAKAQLREIQAAIPGSEVVTYGAGPKEPIGVIAGHSFAEDTSEVSEEEKRFYAEAAAVVASHAPPPPPAPVTHEQVRAALRVWMEKSKENKPADILGKYNAKSVTGLKQDQLADFIKEIQ